ncbi:hypothetical protein ABD91_01920 [Lysinibacillus sphaericus]|uniref:hypothetical protein n=1 Tax=Lysinibacillus sphaericus TaxID=1421 RepID=UPI0018CE0EAF|nr:hypothetical protein [Lysinibacillus sphaericus]MBG9689680.1 hypothetical protein [Lysinibacillus sphaericus]
MKTTIAKESILTTVQQKVIAAQYSFTSKIKSFMKEEDSKNTFVDEGYLMYAGIVLGILALFILSKVYDLGWNGVGNFFLDGVSGQTDQAGLNQWGDQTSGFNRK